VTLSGIAILNMGQYANAQSPMWVTPLGIVTLVKPQRRNALSPMLVTLLGIRTLVNGTSQNALGPMHVTDKPLMVPGMVTAPLGPVYCVMVIVPLLVV
jgi:hypothetical protein